MQGEFDPDRRSVIKSEMFRAESAQTAGFDREDRINGSVYGASNRALRYELGRDPLSAIRSRADAERAGLERLDPGDPRRRLEGDRIGLEERLHVQRFNDQTAGIGLGQRTEAAQLAALMGRNPIGAEAIGIAGASQAQAERLRISGRYDEAQTELSLGSSRLGLSRREYLDGFRARQLDAQNMDLSNPRDTEDASKALRAFSDGEKTLQGTRTAYAAQQGLANVGSFIDSLINGKAGGAAGGGGDVAKAVEAMGEKIVSTLRDLVSD